MAERLGFIGLGIMGYPMAAHLLEHHPVTVYNRSVEKAKQLAAKGAQLAYSPRQVAEASEIIFVMVSDDHALKSVMEGGDGVISAIGPDQIIVDHSTVSVSLTEILGATVAAKGARWCDAPVTGGDVGAKNATLTIMVGADPEIYRRIEPYLTLMGKLVLHVGPTGKGQALKVVSNLVSAMNLMAAAEGIRLGLEAGLSLDALEAVMTHGSAQSFEVTKIVDRVRRQDFNPGFSVANRLKDLDLALALADNLGFSAPLGAAAQSLFAAHKALGFQSEDESSYVLRWPEFHD
ncbi:MAG: 6-phosphogluconate dehydrogenase [Sulfobacillus benefaciens]|uniref:6-phosphogluconate dehydrogenase n=1 Tax=Sulfobacillus benefaciens TaxID=453960 RepID=A0A2T2XCY6_9FIRM|nr:MAG: 6-phosphogluconate dehydrogenase [Sulfobacillus benefaciens]